MDLTKIYGEKETSVKALDDISVEFKENDFTAIMGPSGSGKSTLLHCLAGLDRPSSGQIFLRNQDISTLNDKQLTKIRRDSFGFVFQAFNLIPTLTAEENITLPLPQPVSFIFPSLSKNICGLVYKIRITINTYSNIDIYNGFWNICKIAIINQKYMLFIKIEQ